MAYKLYKYSGKNAKRFVGYFGGDTELLSFFRTPKELEHFGIRTRMEFKVANDVKFFISMNSGTLQLKEVAC